MYICYGTHFGDCPVYFFCLLSFIYCFITKGPHVDCKGNSTFKMYQKEAGDKKLDPCFMHDSVLESNLHRKDFEMFWKLFDDI